MRISCYALPDMKSGRYNVKDSRLDQVDKITKSKKKTYMQVEAAGEEGMLEADAVITPASSRADLILRDLEFVETRLGRAEQENEKALLVKFKAALEKEEAVSSVPLSDDEKKITASYGLITLRPVITAGVEDLADPDLLIARAVREAGCIGFFTTGEKETRSWLIKKGMTAWDAAGEIHSDIQRGFIRAEIISFDDFVQAGGETAAKQAGKLRLEQKTYVMQDADLAMFRFNK